MPTGKEKRLNSAATKEDGLEGIAKQTMTSTKNDEKCKESVSDAANTMHRGISSSMDSAAKTP